VPRVYLPGLNGIRWIAALAVVVHHIEQFKATLRVPHVYDHPAIWSFGGQGVGLFFVLSGYLITMLLLTEADRTGRVAIGAFYVRRVLRIFPLYYLVTLFALLVAPVVMQGMGGAVGTMQDNAFRQIQPDYDAILTLYLVFLPNLSLTLHPPVLFASQAWSVGSEEQFYLIWPWLFRRFRRHLLPVLIAIVVVKIGLTQAILVASEHAWLDAGLAEGVRRFSKLFGLEFMAIGGIAAHLVRGHEARLERLFAGVVRSWLWVPLLIGSMAAGVHVPHIGLAMVYALLIVGAAHGTARGRGLDRPLLNHLGKLSYGIYMLHPLLVLLSLRAVEASLGLATGGLAANALLYALVIVGSIGLAELSYRFFERPFLRRKAAFTRVPSMSTRLDPL
jgi:peptidoglycan/LPS O-acetylase OafA/YrhL